MITSVEKYEGIMPKKAADTGVVVKFLKEIYEKEFGGKERGRFKIARSSLRRLTGLKRLNNEAISDIADAAFNEGFVLIDLGDYFAVVEEAVMLNYRPVPKSVLLQVLEGSDDTTEDDEI